MISLDDSPIRNIWNDLSKPKWSDGVFDLNKAYICSCFSELAYWHIQKQELRTKKRVTVVPCLNHQRLILEEVDPINVSTLIGQADGVLSFVIERRLVVIVGTKINNILFIAFRGTRGAHDWLRNFDVRRHDPFGKSDTRYHRGFYTELASCLKELSEKILNIGTSDMQIYLTGHSLGGAMAAILFSLLKRRITLCGCLVYGLGDGNLSVIVDKYDFSKWPKVISCYTFGMPRYGNFAAVDRLPTPYCIANDKDIVPSLPPNLLGFSSVSEEYGCDGLPRESTNTGRITTFLHRLSNLCLGEAISNHYIDNYKMLLFQRTHS